MTDSKSVAFAGVSVRVRPLVPILRSSCLVIWTSSWLGKRYFLLNSKQSTNLASINSGQLKAFPVAVPTLHEQNILEVRLKQVDAILAESQHHKDKLLLQKKGLMQDLLTGKVSVPV